MKLKNKITGEIKEFALFGGNELQGGVTLKSLTDEWEDASEEPKPWWYIDITLVVKQGELFLSKHVEQFKTVGNYFSSREEAEKAVEKLKAWKRLKDGSLKIRGYELNGGTDRNGCFTGDICLTLDISKPVYEDILQLLFGGEE